MTSKTKAKPTRRKKPRGEQLLDRIDKNPNDREAWNELARGSPTRRKRKSLPAKRSGSNHLGPNSPVAEQALGHKSLHNADIRVSSLCEAACCVAASPRSANLI
jgi:hypothetical protein